MSAAAAVIRVPLLPRPSVGVGGGWAATLITLGALGKPFPKNFRDTIGRLFRRLFRVYAHLYSNHFDHICALGIEGMQDRSMWMNQG